MIDTYSVSLSDLVKEFDLKVEFASTDFDAIRLTVEDVSRPGIQLAGYFDHFDPMRLQVLGNVEMSYLSRLSEWDRSSILDRLFSYKFPALLITRSIPPHPQCLEMAKKHNVTLLRSSEPTSTTVSTIITYLKAALAPRVTRHGVLMEVYGEGVLLTGESGIGKSEAAVELRGIGIVNVAKLFGMGAVKIENTIDLVVNIVPWNTHEVYDRLGLEDQYTEILGVKIPMNTIPITPGRNLAVILEVAAMNNRQRKFGYNPAQEFTEQINRHFENTMGKQL